MSAKLANLIENDYGLNVFCGTCGRCVSVDVSVLAVKVGETMLLPEIGRRSRCTSCGGKGGKVQIQAVRWGE